MVGTTTLDYTDRAAHIHSYYFRSCGVLNCAIANDLH